jgi:Protein of unknown function (DUF2934)
MMRMARKHKIGSNGVRVDIETRRKKQQDLMIRMVERKVRERAQQLYEERGQVEGQALAVWVQAESEIVESTMLAPLYRRYKAGGASHHDEPAAAELGNEFLEDSEPARESV